MDDRDRKITIVKWFIDSLNRGDFKTAGELLAKEATIDDALVSGGPDQAIAVWREFFSAFGGRLETHDMVVDRDTVVVRGVEHGAFRFPFRGETPNGKTYRVSVLAWFVVKENRIDQCHLVRDLAQQEVQLELVGHAESMRREAIKFNLESWEKIVELNTKTVTAAFDRARGYTNLIVLAGYGSFFGLWSLTRDRLTDRSASWSALLILVSATTFVLFETFKMFVVASWLRRFDLDHCPTAGASPEVELARQRKRMVEELNVERRFVAVWHAVLLIVIPTGLFGVVILAFEFAVQLF